MLLRLVLLAFTALFLMPLEAWAQWQNQNWLHLNYTYTDLKYDEPTVMSETGRFPGVRGELGINFFNYIAVSAGGSYMSGNMNYEGQTFGGTPVRVVTKDYVRDLRFMAHAVTGPLIMSYGVAQRYWYDDLVASYRRRTRYDYQPINLTYYQKGFYVRVEHDIWGKGWNKSHMSDTGGGRRDVEFTLGEGKGLGAEVGLMLPSPMFEFLIFLSYHKWEVKESDTKNDGVDNLVEPQNNTQTIQFGIGVAL